ncbi:MAG: flavin reductase family protein [Bauldia sp.]|nr:flavin reductase family protein [Bauldia sp.]
MKNALASFPSGVVIATAVGPDGEHRGFTASSFSSVSMTPPLVLVCLARSANCFDTFFSAEWFGISVLTPDHENLAMRFASSQTADKFSPPSHFEETAHGLKIVSSALATLICHKHANYLVGDHAIIIGEVESVKLGEGEDAMLRYRREFHRLGRPRVAAS